MNIVLGKNRSRSLSDRRHCGLPWGRLALPILLSALIAGCSGCADSSTSALPGDPGDGTPSDRTPQGLLEIAIDNLNRQEEFPSGEMLQQIVDQLNQWVRAQQPRDDWKPDPLVAALPAPLAEIPAVRNLDQLQFPRSDGLALQEAVWLRNVSRWARGTELDDLVQAGRLFDWTVRNIQLETVRDPEAEQRLAQMPWETLFLGRGTVVERAWVFILLARQQGLDAAFLLALPDPNDPAGAPPRPWVTVGILNKDNVYVFDPLLGLPLPAPDGIRLGDAGQLEIRPATLAQLAADDSLLRRLDLDQANPYPLSSSGLTRVIALIEASPAYLARRMKLVESPLLGGRRVVLSTSATAQVARWKAAPQIADAQLWAFPYRTLLDHQNPTQNQFRRRVAALVGPFYATPAATAWNAEASQPLPEEVDPFFLLPRRTPGRKGPKEAPLRKARILHLKGQFSGPQGATESYHEARPSDEQLAAPAKQYYRQALKDVQKLPQDQKQAARQQLEQLTAQRARLEPLLRRAKQDASYWLGLMSFDQGLIQLQQKNPDAALKHYRVAIDYLLARTLEASPELHVATLTIQLAPAQDKPQVELSLEPGPMLPGTVPNQFEPLRPQPLGITTRADRPAPDGPWSVALVFPEPLDASDEKRTAHVRQIRLQPQFDPKACQLENPQAIETYLRPRLGSHLGIPRWEEHWKDERFVFPKQFDAKGAYPIKILAHQQPAAQPWTHGARYNLARSYEATRQYDQAVALYLADPASPAYHGNFLRARWLNQLRPQTNNQPPKPKPQNPATPD